VAFARTRGSSSFNALSNTTSGGAVGRSGIIVTAFDLSRGFASPHNATICSENKCATPNSCATCIAFSRCSKLPAIIRRPSRDD
jgi:hypothetical protein